MNKSVIGKQWSKSKLNNIAKLLSKSELDMIFENYWEYIPNGDYSDIEKLGFILFAMPNSANFPKEFLIIQLLHGPNEKTAYYAKPNMLKTIKDLDVYNELDELIELYKPHKRCLDYAKDNNDWILTCILAEVIDRYPGARTHEDFYKNMIKHKEYIRDFNKRFDK